MKIKTTELTGAALDWAVAKCEGKEHLFDGHEVGRLRYSTDWSEGGPIIERERITVMAGSEAQPHHRYWMAEIFTDDSLYAFGDTPLVAAMRCWVTSRLGEEVDIPEELLP